MTNSGRDNQVAAPRNEAPLAVLALFGRPFLTVWLLRGCSVLGSQIIAFALSLQLYKTSGSLLDLGLLGLIQFVPSIGFALPAGHITDRFAPRYVAAWAQVINAATALLLLVASSLGGALVPVLFVAALMTGTTRAFEHPVNTVLLPHVVERQHVAGAVAWTTSVAKMATLAGPVLAGVLYGLLPQVSYATALVFAVAAASLATTLPKPAPPESGAPPGGHAFGLASAFTGFSVIWRDRVLGGAMVLDLVAVLLGGATAVLPAYALDVLHVGPTQLGMLRAAPGAGAVVLGIWLARHPVARKSGAVLIGTTLVFGLLTCGFGLSRNFMLSLFLLAGIGAADMISIHIRSALVQLRTPPELRGRVGAVNGIFISSSNQIGAFESGLTASWLGLVPAVVMGGAATILTATIIAMVFKPLRQIDRPHTMDACTDSHHQT